MSLITPQMRQAARVVHADAEPFATIQSGVTDYPLTIRGKRLRRLLDFESLYRTDWQGRVRLSSESRTNQLLATPGARGNAPLPTIVSGGVLPQGGDAFIFTRGNTGSNYAFLGSTANTESGITVAAGFVDVKRGSARYAAIRCQGNYPARGDIILDTQGLSIQTINHTGSAGAYVTVEHAAVKELPELNWLRLHYAVTAVSTNEIQHYFSCNESGVAIDGVDTSNSASITFGNHCAAAVDDYHRSYIFPGDTITDFSRTADTVSLSDISGGGGVLDWTGDARVIG